MPAGLPGSTPVQNAANPSLGVPVTFDLISGPKGSPKDNDKDYATGTGVANANASTGGLSTGIGFGMNLGPQGIPTIKPNFNDDYVPGVTKPDNTAGDSTVMYIGGGRSGAVNNGASVNTPYTTGFGIGAAGGGGSRDAGAGPAFTGFTMKMVTAAADVAIGGVIETGFTNRSGVLIPAGMNQFGSGGTATAVPTMLKEEEEEARRVESRKPVKEEDVKEKKELVKAMDEQAQKEEKRIREEEERIKKEREEGAKLPPITGQVHIKEKDDKVDFAAPKATPKKDK